MRHSALIGAAATVVQVDDDASALGADRPVGLGSTATATDVLALLGEGERVGYRTPEVAAGVR